MVNVIRYGLDVDTFTVGDIVEERDVFAVIVNLSTVNVEGSKIYIIMLAICASFISTTISYLVFLFIPKSLPLTFPV